MSTLDKLYTRQYFIDLKIHKAEENLAGLRERQTNCNRAISEAEMEQDPQLQERHHDNH